MDLNTTYSPEELPEWMLYLPNTFKNTFRQTLGHTPNKQNLMEFCQSIYYQNLGYCTALYGKEPVLSVNWSDKEFNLDSKGLTEILSKSEEFRSPTKFNLRFWENQALYTSILASNLISITFAGRQRWR